MCHNDQRKFGRAEATITGTASVTTLDSRDYFNKAMSSIAVAISVTTTAPTPTDLEQTPGDGNTATFIHHLATFVDGVKTAQNGYGPLTGEVHDDLSGDGTGTLVLVFPGSS